MGQIEKKHNLRKILWHRSSSLTLPRLPLDLPYFVFFLNYFSLFVFILFVPGSFLKHV